jgi:6-methylsalicylate decarboxylase
MTANRIDVHQHVVPPFWAAALDDNGGDPSGWYMPKWSPEAAIAYMDQEQIAAGVLSLTSPSVVGWHQAERRTMTRRVNEYTAGLVSKRPSRFGNFATVSLPDIDGALLEIGYALDTLKADGVVLLTNYEGRYLGDPIYEPIWNELNRRCAVVFIHPAKPPSLVPIQGMPSPIIDYPFDTTRTAVHLALSGVLDRYKAVRIILSHAGGYLPYTAYRFSELTSKTWPGAPNPEAILAKFKCFYFDTALSSSPAELPSLKAFVPINQILYGSDFPYAPAPVCAAFNKWLDTDESLSHADQVAINHGNATVLFPRFADEVGSASQIHMRESGSAVMSSHVPG